VRNLQILYLPAKKCMNPAPNLEDNPGKHHELAAYLVILALREAYPCKEENPSQ
jgi:hypothetical protein